MKVDEAEALVGLLGEVSRLDETRRRNMMLTIS
jgi:hypothetical protein